MRVDFPYLKERSTLFGVIARPVAKVVLEHRFPQWMYVDSGADISLIPFSVGNLIGLTRTKKDRPQRISGIGRSSVPIVVKKVSMRLGALEFPARVAWSQIEDVPLLLGRLDVFQRFDVTFRERLAFTSFSSNS